MVDPESQTLVVALHSPDRPALVDTRTRRVRTVSAPLGSRSALPTVQRPDSVAVAFGS